MADRHPDVVLLDDGVVAEIRLSRVSARNALSTGLAEALAATAGRLALDVELKQPGIEREVLAALRAALAAPSIVDLVVTASFYCAVVRVLASLEIDVEESYMPYLKKYPFPV